MLNHSSAYRRTVTILTALALMIMILPMSVAAKGRPETLPNQTAGQAVQAPGSLPVQAKADVTPPAGKGKAAASEHMSDQARFIAERNAWAKAQETTPGHANLLYRYMIASKQFTRESFTFADMQAYLASPEFTAAFYDKATGELDVAALMGAIKGFRLMVAEVDEPDTEAGTDA